MKTDYKKIHSKALALEQELERLEQEYHRLYNKISRLGDNSTVSNVRKQIQDM